VGPGPPVYTKNDFSKINGFKKTMPGKHTHILNVNCKHGIQIKNKYFAGMSRTSGINSRPPQSRGTIPFHADLGHNKKSSAT
jgi:hypothetical protein